MEIQTQMKKIAKSLRTIKMGGGGLVSKSRLTLAIPWTMAHQAPLSMGFSTQEYWSSLPFPFPIKMGSSGNSLVVQW